MPGVDYAILSEWFDWIIKNSFIDVDLIGRIFIQFVESYDLKIAIHSAVFS